METNKEAQKNPENKKSILTDNKDGVEFKKGDDRPVQNSTQQGFGLDDGPNQPLSKEMLNDLQDAGQSDLQRQREEEKAEKKK
ncbi:hypothetical protein QNI19_05125 [Cytophagaceae bacterium DM2B3-1]|uniref:Uncharacterized protein n=1 Tax=Xanthocytophaga flava TaxID=3048013 RepID=A0ABT7CF05_9BACT|nr:hypothetical protein [Xanthocytophaga flavus]MDJ1492303.1 hypothetical protein [Xanthocytophaga flavus]